MKLPYYCLILICAVYSLHAGASDIGLMITKGPADESSNGGFVDLGIELRFEQSHLYGLPEGNRADNLKSGFGAQLNINGRYQYEDFFIEVASASINALNVGYKLYDTGNWSADFIVSPILPYIGDGESNDWAGLADRGGELGAGLRLSYFSSNNIIQLRLLADRDDGYYAGVFTGQNWQHRNWNFHALIGLEFYNRHIMNDYYGVSEKEAQINTDLWPYTVGESITLTTDVGVTYPISERWVFRAYHRYVHLPDDIKNSPIVVRDYYRLLAASVSYVF